MSVDAPARFSFRQFIVPARGPKHEKELNAPRRWGLNDRAASKTSQRPSDMCTLRPARRLRQIRSSALRAWPQHAKSVRVLHRPSAHRNPPGVVLGIHPSGR